jgi:hypothetical protein
MRLRKQSFSDTMHLEFTDTDNSANKNQSL